jgi:hypothetical protein
VADPKQYYRLQSLASRGFYVPGVIPFEELEGNALNNFKHQNNLAGVTGPAGDKRNRKGSTGMRSGQPRRRSLAFAETSAEEPPNTDPMAEVEQDQMIRLGLF